MKGEESVLVSFTVTSRLTVYRHPVPSRAHDQTFCFPLQIVQLHSQSSCGTLSGERIGVPSASTLVLVKCTVSYTFIYLAQQRTIISTILNTVYIVQYIQVLCQSRLCKKNKPLSRSLCYIDSLVTSTVVSLTTAKFKPLTFSVSGFALSYAANIFSIIILYDFCLKSA
jgi:hypothetical protein